MGDIEVDLCSRLAFLARTMMVIGQARLVGILSFTESGGPPK